MTRGKVVEAKEPVDKCPVCGKNFYREGDYQRHLTMIKKGIDTENKRKHAEYFDWGLK